MSKFETGDRVRTAYGSRGVVIRRMGFGWLVNFPKNGLCLEVAEQDIEKEGDMKILTELEQMGVRSLADISNEDLKGQIDWAVSEMRE
uniref:Uncharacterized protein n=1 Tax=viral metagenome TaxID=1070528 RepID=A0A6H2A470_9ZZZZ